MLEYAIIGMWNYKYGKTSPLLGVPLFQVQSLTLSGVLFSPEISQA